MIKWHLIGRIVANRYNLPVASRLVRRSGKTQKSLSYKDRLVNLVGAVRVKNSSVPFPDEVILLDDIFTTGATAEQCARTVMAAGVRRVTVLTIAID